MNEWAALLAAFAVAYTAHAAALTRACLRALRSRASTGDQPTVSVIVCIKDDAEHWPAWWAAMKGQQWPVGTEVIAIDDGSTDELPALLTRAAQEEAFTFAHYRIDESSPGSAMRCVSASGRPPEIGCCSRMWIASRPALFGLRK